MKTTLTLIAIAAAVTFLPGVAFSGDDMLPIAGTGSGRDTGTEFAETAPAFDTVAEYADAQDFGGMVLGKAELGLDVGTVLYNAEFPGNDVVIGDISARGSAAGGMSAEDKTGEIWDHVLGNPGGSDLP
ncbi:MAG: hypothetical protein M0042_09205 [Nitrospiraceae bacterium]|nr:hypothetical protein [Nitrospiraceae bacterium]